jgi:hypothetical protein
MEASDLIKPNANQLARRGSSTYGLTPPLVVIHAVFLKGVGIDVLWPPLAAMTLLGVGMLTISVLRFRKSLD